MEKTEKRNRLTYGLGTLGRDMVYSLVSMHLIFYLTNVLELPAGNLWWLALIIPMARVFDALTDPLMGLVVDNTKTRWGKFKPWLVIGLAATVLFTLLLFADFGLEGGVFIAAFTAVYLLWGISYMVNDIPYWSMLPTLSVEQKEREKIGAVARICANVGLFFVVAGIIPITQALGGVFGGLQQGWFVFTLIVASVMVLGQLVTIFGVKEPGIVAARQPSTSLKMLAGIIFKNDQLLIAAIALTLFITGYLVTTGFGLFFIEYVYGDLGVYPIFAVILGVSQLTALAVFPLFSKKFTRKTLFTLSIGLIGVGYVLFFFAPVTTMVFIGLAGVLLFVGQAFVQLMMLMFLADSVDYGHWKLGQRNDSISFSLQPFIYKMGGAIANGVTMAVVILSGMREADSAADMTEGGVLMVRAAMLIFPMVLMVASFILWRWKYKIDEQFHGQILADLRGRGEIR